MSSLFSDDLYSNWCDVWLLFTTNYTQRLVQWLVDHDTKDVDILIKVERRSLEQTLNSALGKLKKDLADDNTLVQIYSCLREIERQYDGDPRHDFSARVTKVNGSRYVLVPPVRGSVRKGYPADRHFKLNGQIGTAGQLELKYSWVSLQGDDELDWGKLSEFDPLQNAGCLRVGLAPCATSSDMSWRIDEQEQRGLHGQAPLQCIGALDATSLWAVIEQVLVVAYEQNVHILLFPELVFDDKMLSSTRAWLRQHNLAEPRLRLVVAGSRHCCSEEEKEGWSNRCTVLTQGGQILWEQDKRRAFVLDNPEDLKQLQLGCRAMSAFEPTRLGKRVVVRESAAGRLLTPICLDYIDDGLWSSLGADLFLIPVMTGLARFVDKAREMGNRHGAASFICNANTDGMYNDRLVCYLPIKDAPPVCQIAGGKLFTIDVNFCM